MEINKFLNIIRKLQPKNSKPVYYELIVEYTFFTGESGWESFWQLTEQQMLFIKQTITLITIDHDITISFTEKIITDR